MSVIVHLFQAVTERGYWLSGQLSILVCSEWGMWASLGGAGRWDGGHQDSAAFDSCENVICFEWQPNRCCQNQAGARWRHRRATKVPAGVEAINNEKPSENLAKT